jgi:hypothetical protein
VFSFGATLYELCSGEIMPSDGQRWHDIRAGDIYLKSGDLHEVITAMMKHSPQERPSASRLLHISAVLDKLI